MKKKIYQNTIKVYDMLGRKYLKDSLNVFPRERKEFIENLPKGASILDAGCGGGRDAKEFVKKGMNVTGVDLSSVMINIAKKEVPKGKFFKMDVLDLKFPANSFDAIWALAVLLHLERKDIPKALKCFHKVLRPKGVLYVRVKKGQGSALVKEKISGWNERYYTYFSKREIENMIKKVGFKIAHSEILPDALKRPDVKWIWITGIK